MATDLGDLYRLTFTNTSPAGGNVNAGTMTLTITLPDSTATAPVTVPPLSTGVYQYDYLTSQAGRHLARWVGTGANPGAYSEAFDVLPAAPPYLVSLADAKDQLHITDNQDDEKLRSFIESATSVVERIRGESIVRRTITEQHEVRTGQMVLNRTPVISLTSVVSTDGFLTWDVSSLLLSPNGVVSTKPWVGMSLMALTGFISVTYVAGYQVIPSNILDATRIIIEHLWQTRRGSAGGPRPGVQLSAVPGVGYLVPNQALELLGSGMPGFA